MGNDVHGIGGLSPRDVLIHLSQFISVIHNFQVVTVPQYVFCVLLIKGPVRPRRVSHKAVQCSPSHFSAGQQPNRLGDASGTLKERQSRSAVYASVTLPQIPKCYFCLPPTCSTCHAIDASIPTKM
jgi:hypothetical protein